MSNFAFAFVVYDEFGLATRLVNQIRSFYPTIDVLCITDGTDNLEFARLCQEKNVKYEVGERVYFQKFGGNWLERLLRCFLNNSNADSLIKLDPDIIINRTFTYFPESNIAGTFIEDTINGNFVRGACRFSTKDSCIKILDSNLLHDSKYKIQSLYGHKRFAPPYWSVGEESSNDVMISEERVFCDVATRLNLSINNWDEVCCKRWELPSNFQDYAVIHPVKV